MSNLSKQLADLTALADSITEQTEASKQAILKGKETLGRGQSKLEMFTKHFVKSVTICLQIYNDGKLNFSGGMFLDDFLKHVADYYGWIIIFDGDKMGFVLPDHPDKPVFGAEDWPE